MTKTITVTQANIDAGERRQCAKCPVALGMIDAGFTYVRAGTADLSGTLDGQYVSAKAPEAVMDFMLAFDLGRPVSPIAFDAEFEPVN